MKLIITKDDGQDQLMFESNILLFDAWSNDVENEEGHILINVLQREHKTTKDEICINLFGTHEEMQTFLKKHHLMRQRRNNKTRSAKQNEAVTEEDP